jgi:hypothetical protein
MGSMNRVILYKGASECGVPRRSIDELEKGFRAMGLDAAVVDFASNPQSQYVLEEFDIC